MNLDELITKLNQAKACVGGNANIVVDSDAEGNSSRPLSGVVYSNGTLYLTPSH